MSTRATTHFEMSDETYAIVYRHSDGYPEEGGVGIRHFLNEVSKLPDPRFDDPSYLAAKYVVWLAEEFRRAADPLDFLSVGIVQADPGDVEYVYTVHCGERDKNGLPPLTCRDSGGESVEVPREAS